MPPAGELPAELARVVMACLSKAPEGRPESAGTVLAIVERLRRDGGAPPTGMDLAEELEAELAAAAPSGTQTLSVSRGQAPSRTTSRAPATPSLVPPSAPTRSAARRAAPWVAVLAVVAGVVAAWLGARGREPQTVASIVPQEAAPSTTVATSSEPSLIPEPASEEPPPTAPAAAPDRPSRSAPLPAATAGRRSPTATPTAEPTPPPTPTPTVPPTPLPTPSPTAVPQVVASSPSLAPAPATPSPAPPLPMLVSLTPHQARRGHQAEIEIEGKNLPREVRVEVSRGRQRALGIRVLSRKWKQPGVLRVVLLVDSDTPLDVYSVALVDGEGRATNSLPLEIGL